MNRSSAAFRKRQLIKQTAFLALTHISFLRRRVSELFSLMLECEFGAPFKTPHTLDLVKSCCTLASSPFVELSVMSPQYGLEIFRLTISDYKNIKKMWL